MPIGEKAEVLTKTACIPIGPENFKDKWIWCFETKGRFTVKSCYKVIRNQGRQQGTGGNMADSKFWRWIWKLSIPPKLKFFLWRMCHNALATKANLHRRRCAQDNICPCCLLQAETIDHMMFRCQTAQRFWSKVFPSIQMPAMDSNFQSWCSSLQDNVNEEGMTKISYILWSIWKRRNAVVFQQTIPTVDDMVSFLHNDIIAWNNCRCMAYVPHQTIENLIAAHTTKNIVLIPTDVADLPRLRVFHHQQLKSFPV
ncbi:Putative ribonuclease H protein At1g65750 [Linum perenne]